MTVSFDLDFVTFLCEHPKCREIFEISLSNLAGPDKAICPRCGTTAHLSEENHLLVTAKTTEGAAHVG